MPGNLQRIAGFERLPKMIGDDHDAGRCLQDFAHAGHGRGGRVVELLDAAAEYGALREGRMEHAGSPHVDAEFGAAVAFVRGVEPCQAAADQGEPGRRFQGDVLRYRQLRGGLGQLAIGQTLAPGVDDRSGLHVAVGGRDAPGRGAGRDQHRARARAGETQFVPRI